ncbi:right-handed parallel beta-helix repeat-containing protein [Undibacterium sp. SXout11W]|uniref:right-handed parallel beta-helix repeat-containing protein n=1 Tax=unclassified Undibacterium TaxID=2630295 RepID=UPI003BF0B58C
MFKKIISSLIYLSLFGAFNSHAEECQSITQLENSRTNTGSIYTSGKHCLDYDILQKRVFDIHAGSFKSLAGNSLLEIRYPAQYVDYAANKAEKTWMKPTVNPPITDSTVFQIDLRGYTLSAEAENMVGIENWSGGLKVSVKNGYINVPGNRDPNYGISLRGESDPKMIPKNENKNSLKKSKPCWPSTTNCEDISFYEDYDKNKEHYRSSDYLVESVNIKAGWRGVIMGGAGNVIRNSTIDVDGHTAIYMYGPGSIIENNTIIIHGQGEAKEYDAAIKLRDADGAVVRNNKIIYKGFWFGKAPAAINLLDSSDVNISENIVENFKQLVRSNGESHFIESGNVIK